MKIFTICRAQHAPLYQRYDLKSNQFISVGVPGTYAPEDTATGAEYRCLGEDSRSKPGMVSHSSDLRPGSFYPENVFITGRSAGDNPLSHEDIEAFCKKLHYGSTRRVILPVGYNKGQMTWDNGVYFSPIENKPDWYRLVKIIKQAGFGPGTEIYEQPNYIEVETQ